jgi:hypothetical protein
LRATHLVIQFFAVLHLGSMQFKRDLQR